uniref:Calcium-channel protein CCH1 n=1 Tax=Palpitomonas bilix TaxID=652834 RepID=A0A7S3DJI7_9EUKA|mmetsp:Transcript_39806/g.102538  ORF Transcript_39806/g.102538 Transcript_39806/m.102538 type:complete len:1693 (+) Transcript_39806:495-5573(+)
MAGTEYGEENDLRGNSTSEAAKNGPGSPDESFDFAEVGQKVLANMRYERERTHPKYRSRALFCLSPLNPFRLKLVQFVEWKWFDRTVLFLIVANCVFLAMADPLCEGFANLGSIAPNNTLVCHQSNTSVCCGSTFCSRDNLAGGTFDCGLECEGWIPIRAGHVCNQGIGRANQISELVFQILFTVEMVFKILSKGFILHRFAYLRDVWNWIDFLVVILGWLGMIPNMGNFTALRTIRVLRPLRTMSRIPGMRPLISALLSALKPLLDVLILFVFVFLIFGIFAVQLIDGGFRGRCFYSEGPLAGLLSEPSDDGEEICSLGSGGRVCPPVNGYRTHCSIFKDSFVSSISVRNLHQGPLPGNMYNGNPSNFQGYINFDNIGWACFAIFQSISLEGWTDIMYTLQDGWSLWGARMFFFLLIVIGAMFVINLALAVIADNYDSATEREKKLLEEERRIREEEEDRSGVTQEKADRAAKKKKDAAARAAKPRSAAVEKIRKLVESNGFMAFIMALILINTLTLSAEHFDLGYFNTSLYHLASALPVNSTHFPLRGSIEVNTTAELIQEGPGGLFINGTNVNLLSMPLWLVDLLEYSNYVLTAMFFIEMVLKLVGLGLRGYVKSGFNVFDGVIVIVSIIELGIYQLLGGGGGFLSVLRAFRLFRVFKLASSWKELRNILRTIQDTAGSLGPLTVVLLIFMFIFSLLGMQMFGGTFPAGVSSNFDELFPGRYGFGAFMTIFQILTGENWNEVMYNGMAGTSVVSLVYFYVLVCLGIYIIMNLFLAILLGGFGAGDDDEDEEADAETHLQSGSIIKESNGSHPNDGETKRVKTSQVVPLNEESEPADPSPASGINPSPPGTAEKTVAANKNLNVPVQKPSVLKRDYALFCMSKYNPFRSFLNKLLKHKVFDNFILVCIILSSTMLAVENPIDEPGCPFVDANLSAGVNTTGLLHNRFCGICCGPNSAVAYYFGIIDKVFITIFTIEMLLKIFALGLILHKGAYLRDPWNWIDCIVVVISLFIWVMEEVAAAGSSSGGFSENTLATLKALRSLRTFRALRPLRVVNRNPGMKVAVLCLLKSLPSMANVLAVCLLFYLIFAILGTQLFKGTYYTCRDSNDAFTPLEFAPDGSPITNIIECQAVGGQWQNPIYYFGFDNVPASLLTLFEASTLEGWLDVMQSAIDGRLPGQTPVYQTNPQAAWFFFGWTIVGAFFVMNLFIGVVIDNYNEIKRKQDGEAFMTSDQKAWVDAMKIMLRTKPKKKDRPPKNKGRKVFYDIVTKNWFDYFIMSVIVCNVATMAMKHFNESTEFVFIIDVLSKIFTSIFILEAILKLIGLGPKRYFTDAWCIFDFVVVLGSIPSFIPLGEKAQVTQILRVFRIARLLKLVRTLKGLRRLFETLLFSLPSIVNIGSLLMLLFFIYAVLGVNFFYNVSFGDNLNRHANFEEFGTAFFTLFRMTTGENWNGIMHDCMIDNNCKLPVSDYAGGCGNIVVALIYFISFTFLGTFIILNLFIAVILDNFSEAVKNDNAALPKDNLQSFAEAWAEFDHNANRLISREHLFDLLRRLEPPLGLGIAATRAEVLRVLATLNIPDRNGEVQYMDTFHELARRVGGVDLPTTFSVKDELEAALQRKKTVSKMPTTDSLASYVPVGEALAATVVQAAFRAFQARRDARRLRRDAKAAKEADLSVKQVSPRDEEDAAAEV